MNKVILYFVFLICTFNFSLAQEKNITKDKAEIDTLVLRNIMNNQEKTSKMLLILIVLNLIFTAVILAFNFIANNKTSSKVDSVNQKVENLEKSLNDGIKKVEEDTKNLNKEVKEIKNEMKNKISETKSNEGKEDKEEMKQIIGFINDLKGRLEDMNIEKLKEQLQNFLSQKINELLKEHKIEIDQEQINQIVSTSISNITNNIIKRIGEIQEIKSISENLKEINNNVNSVNQKVENLEKSLNDRIKKVEEDTKKLNENVEEIGNETKNINNKVGNIDKRIEKLENVIDKIKNKLFQQEIKEIEQEIYKYEFPDYLYKRDVLQIRTNIKDTIYVDKDFKFLKVYGAEVIFVLFNVKSLFKEFPYPDIYLLLPTKGIFKNPPADIKQYFPEGTYKYISKYYDIAFDGDTENYTIEKFAFLQKDEDGEYKIFLRGSIRR